MTRRLCPVLRVSFTDSDLCVVLCVCRARRLVFCVSCVDRCTFCAMFCVVFVL